MKTFFGTNRWMAIVTLVIGVGLGVLFAEAPAKKEHHDKYKNGTRLHLGGGKNQDRAPLNVSQQSLERALDKLKAGGADETWYKVKYYRNVTGYATQEYGTLEDLNTTDISVPKDIGGLNDPSATAASGGSPPPNAKTVGPSSTQCVTFRTTQQLKDFVNSLEPGP